MILDRLEILRQLKDVDRVSRSREFTRSRADGFHISNAIALVRDLRGYRGGLTVLRAAFITYVAWGKINDWLREFERSNRKALSRTDRLALHNMRVWTEMVLDPDYLKVDYSKCNPFCLPMAI